MKEVVIKSIHEIAVGSFLLYFKRDFEFIPGQVIGINIGDKEPERLYSIASGNADEDIIILFTEKDEGYLTPRLAKCKAGDRIEITPAFGNFICREDEAFFIASGTGIAPFHSMIKSGQAEGKILIHGSRTISHFYFQDELTSLMKDSFIRCCSSETGPGIYPGRLTKYLTEQNMLPADRKYYLCGSAEMVVDTRDILISKGIPYENIVAEIYF
ncbi:MAG: oxidoreductase [Bacteroidales bacterium]|nr:oxidoreductase [Bacteroidales bacterium]